MGRLGGRTLSRPWRLIVTSAADGPWNMAVDEALAESVRQGGAPFLRFYRWNPATLSLGRFQNPQTGLAGAALSVPRVRRLTGGGAIWHDDELTYSLGCLQADVGQTGVKASFETLCGFLVDTWRSLGWDACFAKDGGATGTLGVYAPACFAAREEYDILVNGKKLGGNAQRRDRTAIFQHGSLPRRLDHARLETLFQIGFRPAPDQTTDLETCGWSDLDALIPRLTASFETRLGVRWTEGRLSAAEEDRARSLVEEKYGNPGWTETGSGALRPG